MAYNPIVIPSKHIYGKPKFTTPNNDINTVYVDENTYSEDIEEVYNQSNVSSNTISHKNFYSEWSEIGLFERYRTHLECYYHTFTVDITSERNLQFDKFRPVIYINTHGSMSTEYNFENKEIQLQRMSLSSFDYNIYNVPTVDTDLVTVQNFVNQQIINKNGYQLDIISANKATCTIIYLQYVIVWIDKEELVGANWGNTTLRATAIHPQIDRLDININCNYSSLITNTKKYGTQKNDITLNSNELMQVDTTIIGTEANNSTIKISEFIASKIINSYTNGKKTMSLEAGYGDYYYADGTPYGGVAGKKMLLQVGDIVQPMRWDGSKDVPYSLDIYGNSRVFEITSAELNVGGAPKLYLELLEKTT